jgi:hypothetical protein
VTNVVSMEEVVIAYVTMFPETKDAAVSSVIVLVVPEPLPIRLRPVVVIREHDERGTV